MNPAQASATYKAFLCHASEDSQFVVEVAKHLKRNLDSVYLYEECQRSDQSFITTINQALDDCSVMVIFVGSNFTQYQVDEANAALEISKSRTLEFFIVLLPGQNKVPPALHMLSTLPKLRVKKTAADDAYEVAKEIVYKRLRLTWQSDDDLPLDPHLFDYEKDIIGYYIDKARLESEIAEARAALSKLDEDSSEYSEQRDKYRQLQGEYAPTREKQLSGCPAEWPKVACWTEHLKDNQLDPGTIGNFRPPDARVVAAALSSYHCRHCFVKEDLCFPEAGPREQLAYPRPGQNLNVAVLTSGGIAPGTNAVIDGITQRHHMYAEKHRYDVQVYGFRNGFQSFDDLKNSQCTLITRQRPDQAIVPTMLATSDHVDAGGAILGTSRYEALIDLETRKRRLERIVSQLFDWRIDILYIIGGDGSMKAAHAIWSFAQEYAAQRGMDRRLSVVAIPKTMDNDILWVWQTFGFLSAVERARELIEHLATEVRSNPRLGVVQLFGSDSGFVVSHAVLASRTGVCDAALIPEVDFSMDKLADYLRKTMYERRGRQGNIPYGFVVLAETAIPTDAHMYLDDDAIDLSNEEKAAVAEFNKKRESNKRIQGQTDDALRTAGLKIVSRGLAKLLPPAEDSAGEPDWSKLRVFTNEPRHLLRATPPRSSDIITAQRLGILAVDNALAGYTDFMVSQWLTEYVLVPLKLVVLGRKRIPREGIFWKSVIAKTGQPFDLT